MYGTPCTYSQHIIHTYFIQQVSAFLPYTSDTVQRHRVNPSSVTAFSTFRLHTAQRRKRKFRFYGLLMACRVQFLSERGEKEGTDPRRISLIRSREDLPGGFLEISWRWERKRERERERERESQKSRNQERGRREV